MTSSTLRGYTAAERLPSESSSRLAQALPNLPRFLYHLRRFRWASLVQGFFGPEHFDDMAHQHRIALHDDVARDWLRKRGGFKEEDVAIVIACGVADTLSSDSRFALVEVFTEAGLKPTQFDVRGAGHYPLVRRLESCDTPMTSDIKFP